MAVVSWLQDQARCYFGNAQAKRDFRTQLRGNRAIWLWSFYLLFLTIAAGASYGEMMGGYGYYQTRDAYGMQQALKGLYGMMLSTLSVLMALIAPALTAAAITTERQRRSLDLIFSAPVTPKYLLVGKMLSTYRYVWMLLVLSLPFTALAVVLGGATAWDVFSTYVSLSLVGLIYSSIGLMISSVAARTFQAIFYSYFAVAGYLVAAFGSLVLFVFPTVYRGVGASSAPEWMTALMMFTGGLTFGADIGVTPTLASLVLFVLLALFLVKLFLAGAGSALTARAGKETAALRIQSVLLVLLVSLAAYLGTTAGTSVGMTPVPIKYMEMVFSALVVLIAFLPTLTCFGTDGPNRSKNDGIFRIKTTFTGTPAGALPFILLCVSIMVAPAFWVDRSDAVALGLVAYTLGVWIFMWGVGRFISGTTKALSSAKATHFVSMMFLFVLPDTLAFTSGTDVPDRVVSLWHPLFANSVEVGVSYGVVLALMGLVLALVHTRPRKSAALPPVPTS